MLGVNHPAGFMIAHCFEIGRPEIQSVQRLKPGHMINDKHIRQNWIFGDNFSPLFYGDIVLRVPLTKYILIDI